MAEKTKLKWLRKEFSSSEELEYYLTQLKHQDKLKSDIIALLERFQHLLFQDYEPDFLTLTYNGQWDVSFGPTMLDEQKKVDSTNSLLNAGKEEVNEKVEIHKKPVKTTLESSTKIETNTASKAKEKNKPVNKIAAKEEQKAKVVKKEEKVVRKHKKVGERIDLFDLLEAKMLMAGAKLKHKSQTNIFGMVTREGNLKVGKEEYSSLSGAATSLAPAGRRDGWLCWLFQDSDGEWKSIDLLRDRWREKFAGQR
ncbi:MAG: hypothetical protein WAQ98_09400 [Blastocatellia bacterium]